MDTQTPAQRVGLAVDAERVRAGITRATLAGRLGWSLSRLQRRLAADPPFKVDELSAVAQAIGCPVSRFWQDVAAP